MNMHTPDWTLTPGSQPAISPALQMLVGPLQQDNLERMREVLDKMSYEKKWHVIRVTVSEPPTCRLFTNLQDLIAHLTGLAGGWVFIIEGKRWLTSSGEFPYLWNPDQTEKWPLFLDPQEVIPDDSGKVGDDVHREDILPV